MSQGRDPLEAARLAFGDLTGAAEEAGSLHSCGRVLSLRDELTDRRARKGILGARAIGGGNRGRVWRLPSGARAGSGRRRLLDRRRDAGTRPGRRRTKLWECCTFRRIEFDQAAPYLDRAVQLNSRSFLTYYYHGNLARATRRRDESRCLARAEASYDEVHPAQPKFRPGLCRPGTASTPDATTLWIEALQSARRAASLEPARLEQSTDAGSHSGPPRRICRRPQDCRPRRGQCRRAGRSRGRGLGADVHRRYRAIPG